MDHFWLIVISTFLSEFQSRVEPGQLKVNPLNTNTSALWPCSHKYIAPHIFLTAWSDLLQAQMKSLKGESQKSESHKMRPNFHWICLYVPSHRENLRLCCHEYIAPWYPAASDWSDPWTPSQQVQDFQLATPHSIALQLCDPLELIQLGEEPSLTPLNPSHRSCSIKIKFTNLLPDLFLFPRFLFPVSTSGTNCAAVNSAVTTVSCCVCCHCELKSEIEPVPNTKFALDQKCTHWRSDYMQQGSHSKLFVFVCTRALTSEWNRLWTQKVSLITSVQCTHMPSDHMRGLISYLIISLFQIALKKYLSCFAVVKARQRYRLTVIWQWDGDAV